MKEKQELFQMKIGLYSEQMLCPMGILILINYEMNIQIPCKVFFIKITLSWPQTSYLDTHPFLVNSNSMFTLHKVSCHKFLSDETRLNMLFIPTLLVH